MTDWINKVAEEGRRRVGEQQEEAEVVRQIQADSHSLMQELEKRVQRDVDQANKQLYNSAKVFEVRHDMGIHSDERTNDFVAMTADYPSATMYVLLNPSKRLLSRKLVTKKDSNSDYREEKLPEIEVSLGGGGNAVFLHPNRVPQKLLDLYLEDERGLLDDHFDEVARLIVEPVITAHTGIQMSDKTPGRLGEAVPVSLDELAPAKAKSPRFSFVADSRISTILERDYEELQGLDPDKSTKSVLVLSGEIIEGLLFDALVANGNFTFEVASNESLKSLIHHAVQTRIIQQDKLSDVLRSYRNLIHPAREVRDSVRFTKSDAKLAINAVDIIMDEVREWHSMRESSKSKADVG
jgi:hypothetical protein